MNNELFKIDNDPSGLITFDTPAHDFNIDRDYLLEFENQLNTRHPEQGEIPAEVLGYGEISAILKISGIEDLAFKRLPPFESDSENMSYQASVEQYAHDLTEKANIQVLPFQFFQLKNNKGESISYMAQPCLPPQGFGHTAIKALDNDETCQLLEPVIDTLVKLEIDQTRSSAKFKLGVDGQISNWHFDLDKPGSPPKYIDISTPFIRSQNNKEILNPKIFLQAVPKVARKLVKALFLQEVLDRYYDMRLVIVDLLANLHKEQQSHKIDSLISMINDKFDQGELGILPISRKEVDDYYRNDARIWRLFLMLRYLDRYITTRIFKRDYNFVLPGDIQR